MEQESSQGQSEYFLSHNGEKCLCEKSFRDKVEKNISLRLARSIKSIDEAEHTEKERDMCKFGLVFESMAMEENRLRRFESSEQAQLRELIEHLCAHAEILLGMAHTKPSRPDGIKISFDCQGRPVIDEVIEYKSSVNAYQHGIDKNQPVKTLETVGRVVDEINCIIIGTNPLEIKTQDIEFSFSDRIKRGNLHNQVKRVASQVIRGRHKITYSPDLIYRVIIPRWVEIPQFNPDHLKEKGYVIRMEISKSMYSKENVFDMVKKITG